MKWIKKQNKGDHSDVRNVFDKITGWISYQFPKEPLVNFSVYEFWTLPASETATFTKAIYHYLYASMNYTINIGNANTNQTFSIYAYLFTWMKRDSCKKSDLQNPNDCKTCLKDLNICCHFNFDSYTCHPLTCVRTSLISNLSNCGSPQHPIFRWSVQCFSFNSPSLFCHLNSS